MSATRLTAYLRQGSRLAEASAARLRGQGVRLAPIRHAMKNVGALHECRARPDFLRHSEWTAPRFRGMDRRPSHLHKP